VKWEERQGRLTASTIEKAVTGLDGIVNDIGGNGVVDLPEAEAHLGHLIAAVELDSRRHCDDLLVGCVVSRSSSESVLQVGRGNRQTSGRRNGGSWESHSQEVGSEWVRE
jgi:hypothetical protein